MAEEAHEIFQKAGIDPVSYYYLEDVIAGTEVSEAFARSVGYTQCAYFKKRQRFMVDF